MKSYRRSNVSGLLLGLLVGSAVAGVGSQWSPMSSGASLEAAGQASLVADARRYLLNAAGAGWNFAPLVRTGTLRADDNLNLIVSLEAGVRYRIAGQCDKDCTDLDLQVSRDGRKVVEDLEVDDVPIVHVTPPTDGNYDVKVIMVTCKVNPCGWAVGVLKPNSGM
jgi:hypothetical protein